MGRLTSHESCLLAGLLELLICPIEGKNTPAQKLKPQRSDFAVDFRATKYSPLLFLQLEMAGSWR